MRVIILKGSINGSIIIGDNMRIKLASDIKKSRLVYGNSEVLKVCVIDSKNTTIKIPKMDIDRCMILGDDDNILSFGACSGGVDKTKLLLFADRSKREKENKGDNKEQESKGVDTAKKECEKEVANFREDINEKTNNSFFDKVIKNNDYQEVCGNFFESIEKDIEKMLEIYPHNKVLESLVYDSVWIDINIESEKYSLGIIKNNGIPEVIAYGIPCDDYELEKSGYERYDYLPLDRHNPYKNGYFLIYQNAKDGSILQTK